MSFGRTPTHLPGILLLGAALGALLAARPAAATAICPRTGSHPGYSTLIYAGAIFTSVQGRPALTDSIHVAIPVTACLQPNHAYSLGSADLAGATEVWVGQHTSDAYWMLTQGQAESSIHGTFRTDANALPTQWHLEFQLGRKSLNRMTILVQQTSRAVEDYADSAQAPSGIGMNKQTPGQWSFR